MAINYPKLRARVRKLMKGAKQGEIKLRRYTTSAAIGAGSWKGGVATGTEFTLDAACFTVERKYVDNALIVASDREVIFSVPELNPEPTMGLKLQDGTTIRDTVVVDGRECDIKKLERIPEAGIAVAFILFVSA